MASAAPGSKRAQPPWSPPPRPDLASPDSLPGVRLKLYNRDPIHKKKIWLENGLKNGLKIGLRFHLDSMSCVNYPFLGL